MPMQLTFKPGNPCSFSGQVAVGITAAGMPIPSRVKFRVELQPLTSGATFQIEPNGDWEVINSGASALLKSLVPTGTEVTVPISIQADAPGPKSANLVVTVLKTGDAVVECLGSPLTLQAT